MIPRTSQLRTTNLDLTCGNFQRETANPARNRGEVLLPVCGCRDREAASHAFDRLTRREGTTWEGGEVSAASL